MVRHSLVVALASVLLVTGCSGSDSKPKPSPTTAKAVESPFASVGADEWDDPATWRAGDLPAPPEGSSAAQLKLMAGIIDPWSRTALFQPEVLQGKDVVKTVSSSLPPIVAKIFSQNIGTTMSPQLTAGNVFSTQPSGPSKVSSFWKADLEKGPNGTPVVRLRLQVRVVYPIGDRLIGTIRDFGLLSPPGTSVGEALAVSTRWYAYGAEPCELINKGVMTPLADKAEAKKDLGLYADIVERQGFQDPEAIDVRSPDELKDSC
ncbi:MAG: hypothetical protein ABIN55_12875 [Aeromicrobium sp.]